MTLRTYILKRLVISIFILWVIATINYVIFRGDPMAVIHEWEWQYIDPATKETLLESFGPIIREHMKQENSCYLM